MPLEKNECIRPLQSEDPVFANGFAYTKTAAGKDTASLTSKAFAPAYIPDLTGFRLQAEQ